MIEETKQAFDEINKCFERMAEILKSTDEEVSQYLSNNGSIEALTEV